MAQKLVNIPVWTENAIFGERISHELLAWRIPHE